MRAHITKYVGVRGTTWQAWVDLPPDPETGKRRQKHLTAPTKKGVEDLAAQLIASQVNGTFGEADASKITVAEYLTRWLDSITETMRPASKHRYADLVRLHVAPIIGKVQLRKLTAIDIQSLYADRMTKGRLSATTVSNIHFVLHAALKDAVRWGLLTRNVTEFVSPPRKAGPVCNAWSQEQAAAFLAVTDQGDDAALWRLALFTGMRRGEILALRWQDVDLARKVVAVRHTFSRGASGFEMGEPKSAHGRRSIAVPDSVVKSLHKHRIAQLAHRVHLGELYTDNDMVFATPTGEPLPPNTLASRFRRLTAKAGVPKIRIHDLRHTSATLMLANNVHPKIVQERLGHADVSMTLNRYSHVTMDMQREAADQLDTLLAVDAN